MRSVCLAALWVLLAGGIAQRAALAAADVDEVVDCVRANLPRGDELRAITLVSRDRTGRESVMQASVFARKSDAGDRRILLVLTQPEVLKDSSVLILRTATSEKFWLHTPQVGRRELTGMARQEGLLGSDISVEDLLQLEGTIGASAQALTRLPDASVDGRAVYQIESRPPLGQSPYSRVVTAIDREWCVPVRAEFFEAGASGPRKRLTVPSSFVLKVGNSWVAHRSILRDLRDETESEILLRSLTEVATLPAVAFNPDELGKLRPVFEVPVPEIRFEPPVAARPAGAPQ
jgi:hypothetical protein